MTSFQNRLAKYSGYCTLYFFVLLLTACSFKPQVELYSWSGLIMGTNYQIKLVVEGEFDRGQVERGVLKVLDKVDKSMSGYITDSELNRFNQAPANKPFTLSTDLAQVITQALQVSEQTKGAFDISVAPLVDLWGFGASGRVEKQPKREQVEAAKSLIGYNKLRLSQQSSVTLLEKNVDGVRLDLSAIAKGYAVDKVASYLLAQGIDRYLIDIGGELGARGLNDKDKVWRIGIETPDQRGQVQQVIQLTSTAIATSGDYRNFIVFDGKNYSHTIDPRIFRPVNHRLASVSVIAQRASTADALATALMVMGDKEAISFAQNHAIAAYFVIRSDDAGGQIYRTHYTEQFAPYLVKKQ